MSMKSSLPYLAALAVGAILVTYSQRKKTPPLPPGPPAEFFLGHARLIPPEDQDMVFYELGKQYGDVVYLKFPGKNMIVLNSTKAAFDLLEKRGAMYSDRGDFAVFELMGWHHTLTFLRYGKTFQIHRRLFQDYLAANKIQSYSQIITAETNVLLQCILHDVSSWENHIERFATSIIVNVAYGFRIESDDDEYLKITSGVKHALSNSGSPGGSPVDLLPFLKHMPNWFPGTYYAKFGRENKKHVDAMRNYPLKLVQESIATGKAKPSFLSSHLEGLNREGASYKYSMEDIKGAAGTMYAGGAETTSSALASFFYSMTLHPEVQQRAQKQIDDVVGTDRLPSFDDRKQLPYIEAIYQEILRCYPVVPMGVPHLSTEEDVYRGMYIPKGSMVIANTRGMSLDEKVYKDPFTFDPTRYLPTPEGRNEPFPIATFGFGRRVCPGRYLAESSVWLAIASILATFKISKAIDANGKEITPSPKFISGITSHPAPFPCVIKPRNEIAFNLVKQAPLWGDE